MWARIEYPVLLAVLTALIAGAIVWWLKKYPAKKRKAKLSLILHTVIAVLCALAVCSFSVSGFSGERAAFLLIDVSASASDEQDAILQAANDAVSAAPEGQKTGVIAFGKNAMVETPLGRKGPLNGIASPVDPSGSDLTDALSLAGALLPSDAAGSVAVITDGQIGEAEAGALIERGVPVSILVLEESAKADAQVSRVSVPSLAYEGQRVSVHVTVDSTVSGEATLLLFANRDLSVSRDVTLRKGENTFVFSDIASSSGVIAYEAQILLSGDGVSANNRMGAYMAVQGTPRILIAEGKAGAGAELKKLLTAAGMACDVLSAQALPETSASLRTWHAIALCNVDADSLNDAQVSALRDAVRVSGRGLAVFGGDQSYALGAYRGSGLEEMLPVTMDVKSTLDIPSLALILALDKSGSMTEGRFGITRLEVAKEAAARAAEVLLPTDEIGVIAFDDAAQWVVPLQKAEDTAAIQNLIGTIRPGGGTAFYSPLTAAYEALKQSAAAKKHVIFLTDGEPGDQGFEGVIRAMAENGITLTTVAVGTGANENLLLSMAETGGGRAWAANEFDSVPKIFTKETMMLSGAYVQNRVFTPIVTETGALTDFDGFPSLSGYLGTTEKPQASVALISDREEPILAWWQYGAGRVICWTSDLGGAWSEQFLLWDQAAAFFGGILSYALPGSQQAGSMTVSDGLIRYTYADASESGAAEATVILPTGEKQTVLLSPASPDTYEAPLPDAGPGVYAVTARYSENGETLASLDGGTVKPYSEEYDLRFSAGDALERLAVLSGGAMVDTPEALFSAVSQSARTRFDMTLPLTIAALILFVLDAAQRRLPWEKWLARPENPEPAQAKPKEKRQKKQPDAKEAQGQTANALWQTMQKRKRM
ncbi:MAG: VWA domain-containing protein [Clostridia bacterium]|nr:VWA domain-containing protein [Clostridia bacterium]